METYETSSFALWNPEAVRFFSLAKDPSTYLTKMKTFNLRIQNWSACQKLVSGKHRRCLPKSGLNKSLCFFLFFVFCCCSCFSFFLVHRTENSISLEAKLCLQPKLFPTHAQQQFRLKENFCSLQRRHGALESSQCETFWSLFLSSELTHLPPSTGPFPVAFSQMPGLIAHSRRGFWLNISRQGPLNGDWRQLAPHRPKEVSSST